MPDTMSPASWLAVLEPLLDAQAKRCQLYRSYYEGNHRRVFATAKWREAFGLLFAQLADNWMPVVVDAAVERLGVVGFRFGEDEADAQAWKYWQSNNMDAESIKAFTEAVKCGRSFILVTPPTTSDGTPRITVEHPHQMVVAVAAGNHRERLAALKRWTGNDGYQYATLYLPDQIAKYRSQSKVLEPLSPTNWQRRPDDEGGRNPLGLVPVVPIENNPDMLAGGQSDLATAIPIQDAINKLASDMLVSSEFNAYPQRWATGLEVPKLENGQPDPAALFRASQGHIWVSQNKDTQFGQLTAGDLGNYVKAIEMWVQHLAAQSRTPPHYLLGAMVNISGDALKAAETGLVARVKRKQVDFSDSLEDVIRLCFKATGADQKAGQLDAETIWRDPESRSPGVIADSLVKKRQIGVPLEVLWEEAGYTPQQIQRMKRLAGLPDRPPAGATLSDVRAPGAEPAPVAPANTDFLP